MPATSPESATSTAAGYAQRIALELERIRTRRSLPAGAPAQPWGLSLSGGGIRSATFCLGVLQALGRAPLPPETAALPLTGAATPSAASAASAAEDSLLGQVDYLSTVSGGGYIGTFFASLFVPGRVTPGADAAASAATAYDTLRHESGRLRANAIAKGNGASNAMCWLRENGRYLAPSSGGDLLYGVATAVRAWVGLQLVVGLVLLVALGLLNVVKNGLLLVAARAPWTEFIVTLAKPGAWVADVWLSGLWMFPVLVLACWAVPCGVAYWLTYPPAAERRGIGAPALQSLRYWAGYGVCAAVLTLTMLAGRMVAAGGTAPPRWSQAVTPFAVILAGMGAGALWFMLAGGARTTFAALRVRLTRQLTLALKAGAVLAFLAFVDTLAQSLYLAEQTLAKPLTAAAVLTWLVRRLAPRLKGLQDSKKMRLPLDLMLSLGAAALALLVVTVWDYGVIWLQWQSIDLACRYTFAAADLLVMQWKWLGLLLLGAGTLTALIGRYPQFLNLSSLQGLYSARLTRAYQGASNEERFANAGAGGNKSLSSAEALPSDHLGHAQYNANPYAPLHIINICLNQNVDPAEQLVQRDRKGRPLAILPAILGVTGTGVGADPSGALPFAIDGEFHASAGAGSEDTLTVGEWIGVSGAAAATGGGRRTSAAMALLLGLANVRLGRWWCSGLEGKPGGAADRLFRRLLPTQAYLSDELGAHFYGTRRPRHYLSDGGHFENLGIYELLRPERKLKLVIACDCGADPAYQFEDLANLIRLARIDFDIDIEVDTSVTVNTSPLYALFGTAAALVPPTDGSPAAGNQCALLLNVFRGPRTQGNELPDMRIVLIKPAPIAAAPLDVVNYRAANPSFPQQTTGDQFFDEAQWESYRKLGFEIGRRLFDSGDAALHAALWKVLLGPVKTDAA